MTRRYQGAYPNINFPQQSNEVVEPSLMKVFSGQLTVNQTGVPIGAAKGTGRVVDAWISVLESGKDDSSTLSLTADVKINGTSCLTTQPILAHVSGEASQQKTTKEDDDTGVTQAVVDSGADDYAPGDIFTIDLTLTRTASPTTEMSNVAVVVELEPSS